VTITDSDEHQIATYPDGDKKVFSQQKIGFFLKQQGKGSTLKNGSGSGRLYGDSESPRKNTRKATDFSPKDKLERGKTRSRGNIIYIIFPYYNISISWPWDDWSSLGIPEENPSNIKGPTSFSIVVC